MRLILLGFVCAALLSACAPRQQLLPETSVVPVDGSYAQTLLASFYPALTRLGITVETVASFSYVGPDTNAAEAVVAQLYVQNEGFCGVRGGTLRADGRPHVLVLSADGDQGVRGVVYDLARKPRLTYAYFAGRSLRALPTRTCSG